MRKTWDLLYIIYDIFIQIFLKMYFKNDLIKPGKCSKIENNNKKKAEVKSHFKYGDVSAGL